MDKTAVQFERSVLNYVIVMMSANPVRFRRPSSSTAGPAKQLRGLWASPASKIGLAVLLLWSNDPAEARLRWTLDPAATEVRFSLGATLHTVHGTATVHAGELSFEAAGGTVDGEIVIDATSLDTANQKRDRILHQEVLESEQFPEIVLRDIRILGDLESTPVTLQVEAEIVLHGDAHLMRLEATVQRQGAGSAEDRLSVTTAFDIPYVDWGLEDPSKTFLRVKKTVQIEIVAVGPLGAVEH